ncbi:MAG TPA: ACT domain-containing protein, partial [Ardenticatenaceae bacterium]|nr:ACT domain-containing protein [Ardenticatenaceae bacterium]
MYDRLLGDALSQDEAHAVLASIGFADWNAAYRSLRRLAADDELRPAMAACLPPLLAALSHAANPDRALVSFERFVRADADPAALLSDLAAKPRTVEMLVTLFAGSQFLTEILLRQPQGYRELTDRQRLVRTKSAATFDAEARAAVGDAEDSRSLPRLLKSGDVDAALDALRRFQRWELLRLGACDFFGLLDLPAITMQLSHLADSIVRVCLDLATRETQTSSDGLAVIALGKLGGAELNYSSDIDLLFLAASDGSAYRRPAQRLIEMLGQTTAAGFLYRVDLRLRPWGRDGALVSTVEGHLAYLQRHARLWEKQALLKARAIAGDLAAGADFLDRAGPLLFDAGPELVRAEVHAVKQRIEAGLRRRGQEWGEVKLGEGSIRDVEFIAQAMQLIHGRAQPRVRAHNSLEALARLEAARILAPGERRTLEDGYVFLRSVEHALQLMDFQQTHALPGDEAALAQLARRLGFTAADAGSTLVARYEEHRTAIRSIYNARLVESYRLKVDGSPSDAEPSTFNFQSSTNLQSPISNLQSPPAPTYEQVFRREEIREHEALAARLNAGNLAEVDGMLLGDGRWRVTVVAYDYLGELSLICGLLLVYGFNILDGQVFSRARRRTEDGGRRTSRSPRRRTAGGASPGAGVRRGQIVDVFTVRPVGVEVDAGLWERYGRELEAFLRRLGAGEQHQVQGELARRVAGALRGTARAAVALSPVEIEIDNDASAAYSVLSVRAPDTVGFLYELTNALALNGIDIGRVTVETVGDRARDTLYVTDARGQKITAASKQRELRAATVLVKQFTHLLPHAPDPAGALLNFREFLAQLFSRPGWPDELASLERPEVLDALARLLGVGDFLWEDFLRLQYDNLFPIVRDVAALKEPKSKDQLRVELEAELGAGERGSRGVEEEGASLPRTSAPPHLGSHSEARRRALNAFKDREMFRVDMRQILGHISEFGRF